MGSTDSPEWDSRPYGVAYISSAANHTVLGGWQRVPLNAVDEKHDGTSMFDAVNHLFVCQKAGRYRFTGFAGFSGSTAFSGLGGVEIRTVAGNSGPNHFTVPGYFYHDAPILEVNLTVGQTAELAVLQSSFSAVSYATGKFMTRLTWEYLGD